MDRLGALHLAKPSDTFHGRDIFAPVAAELAAGRLSLTAIGKAVYEWTPGWLDDPEVSANKVTGTIITIDAFGNLISNIDQSLIKDFQEPIAHISGHAIPTLTTYGRAKPGELLALINSFGVVEIAKSEGSAAEGIGSERGAPLVPSEDELAPGSVAELLRGWLESRLGEDARHLRPAAAPAGVSPPSSLARLPSSSAKSRYPSTMTSRCR